MAAVYGFRTLKWRTCESDTVPAEESAQGGHDA
jgi:hypothetical protein